MKLWTSTFIRLMFVYFLLFFNMQTILATLPTHAKLSFLSNDFMLSLITGIFALSAIGGRLLAVLLLRRVRRPLLLSISILIVGMSTLAYGITESMMTLLFIRACHGVGFGIGSTIIPTMVTEIIPRHRMGEGIGIFGTTTMIAMAAGPPVGLFVMNQMSINSLVMLSAAAAILILPFILYKQTSKSVELKPKSIASASQKAIFGKLFIPLTLNVLASVTLGSIIGFLVLYGSSEAFDRIGLFFLVNFVAILISRVGTGRLLDQKGHNGILLIGASLLIGGLLVLSFPLSFSTVMLSAFLYGLGFGSVQPALQTWMLRTIEAKNHSTVNMMFYNSVDLGIAAGTMCLGVVASLTSYGFMYGFTASAMVMFLAILGIQMAREKRSQTKQAA